MCWTLPPFFFLSLRYSLCSCYGKKHPCPPSPVTMKPWQRQFCVSCVCVKSLRAILNELRAWVTSSLGTWSSLMPRSCHPNQPRSSTTTQPTPPLTVEQLHVRQGERGRAQAANNGIILGLTISWVHINLIHTNKLHSQSGIGWIKWLYWIESIQFYLILFNSLPCYNEV